MSRIAEISFVRREMIGSLPPPALDSGALGWARKNLFSSPGNSILTVATLYVAFVFLHNLFEFAFLNAVWNGSALVESHGLGEADRRLCATEEQGGIQPDGWFGACWPYVGAYMKQFIYGRYPIELHWRVDAVFALFAALLIPMAIPSIPFKRENAILLLGFFPLATLILLTGGNLDFDGFLIPGFIMLPSLGRFIADYAIVTAILCGIGILIARGSESPAAPLVRNILAAMGILLAAILICALDFGLEPVETDRWGGLLVTLVIAVTGIVASLPIGILLALGRRSKMPIIKLFSVIFIEFWRGIPLITVLFMSSVLLPLFLPEGVSLDKLLRALIGVALFSSAYMAEVVRGGIQALPKGQYEGAMALGLPYWRMMRLIILPQALKLVIPGIVNSFIALFKDTTLVLIIGLFDFLNTIQSSYSNPVWATPVQSLTGYLFAALIYWLFCFSMSRYSLYMERRLNVGQR